jgi:hypothetical protein
VSALRERGSSSSLRHKYRLQISKNFACTKFWLLARASNKQRNKRAISRLRGVALRREPRSKFQRKIETTTTSSRTIRSKMQGHPEIFRREACTTFRISPRAGMASRKLQQQDYKLRSSTRYVIIRDSCLLERYADNAISELIFRGRALSNLRKRPFHTGPIHAGAPVIK